MILVGVAASNRAKRLNGVLLVEFIVPIERCQVFLPSFLRVRTRFLLTLVGFLFNFFFLAKLFCLN